MKYRALPCCHQRIRGVRCPVSSYEKLVKRCPAEPKTIGDHLRKRRIELGLEQTEVAERLGVCRSSLQHWEQNRGVPMPKQMPAIIRFLGYVPFAEEPGFGGRVAYLRKCAGLTQEELSLHAGCSEDLIWRWEGGRNPPRNLNLVCVTGVLGETLQRQGIAPFVGDPREIILGTGSAIC